MASLNTLRTKFGIVLSIVIAGALLAFILSLKTEMGFSGNDPRVGVINGKKINYSEYYNQYEQIKAQSGAQESDEQQSAMLANAAWQALIGKYVLEPGFDKMGLRVTEPERLSMVSGQHPSQAFSNAFADPRAGEYNVAAVGQFLAQAETNAQAQQAWAQLNEQARMEREIAKYLGLIKGGVYVNALEVANGVNAANNTYSGKWAGKKYSAVPDSLIQVKSGDIKAYYNSHKDMFKQTPSRTLSYVVFEVTPTDDDMLALEKSVAEVGAQFAATEELKSFVRANRNGKIADTYVSAAQLSEDEAKALLAGETYGPVLKNNQWTMARVLDSKMVPDTLGIRHIVLPYTQEALADSLLTVIKGGADFAQLASQYSVYEATAANGGEVGVVPFSAFTGEFVAALANAKRGVVATVATDNKAAGACAATNMYPVIKDVVAAATADKPVRIGEVNQDATALNIQERGLGFIDEMIKLCTADGKKVAVVGNEFYVNNCSDKGDEKTAEVIIEVGVPAQTTVDLAATEANKIMSKADTIAIFGSNQTTAEGVITANETLNKLATDPAEGIIGAGFDAGTPQKAAINNGKLIGSVTQSPLMMGYKTIYTLVDVCNGKTVEDIPMDGYWYNADNMEDEDIAPNLYD